MKNKLLLCALVVLLFSCKKNDQETNNTDSTGEFLTGRYILNEGAFNQNNAGISYIDLSGELTNDLYLMRNNVELGDVLQSFTVIGNRGYAVLNNSQKIEVISLNNFKRVATISGLDYPRYMADGGNGKAYVSNGSMSGDLKVIDVASGNIESSIAVGNGPERLLVYGGFLYVCNSGGWLTDNRVSVIDLSDNSVVSEITVGDRPVDIVADNTGNIWVLCSGETLFDANWNVVGHTNATLCRISSSTHEVTASEQIGIAGDHPSQLEINPAGTVLYYENNGVFALDLSTGEFPGDEIISDDRWSLNVDPVNGDIWCAAVPDFSGPSTMYQYNASGILQKSFVTGIGTNGVVFR
jgi:YVTN family beta-propeller protein